MPLPLQQTAPVDFNDRIGRAFGMGLQNYLNTQFSPLERQSNLDTAGINRAHTSMDTERQRLANTRFNEITDSDLATASMGRGLTGQQTRKLSDLNETYEQEDPLRRNQRTMQMQQWAKQQELAAKNPNYFLNPEMAIKQELIKGLKPYDIKSKFLPFAYQNVAPGLSRYQAEAMANAQALGLPFEQYTPSELGQRAVEQQAPIAELNRKNNFLANQDALANDEERVRQNFRLNNEMSEQSAKDLYNIGPKMGLTKDEVTHAIVTSQGQNQAAFQEMQRLRDNKMGQESGNPFAAQQPQEAVTPQQVQKNDVQQRMLGAKQALGVTDKDFIALNNIYGGDPTKVTKAMENLVKDKSEASSKATKSVSGSSWKDLPAKDKDVVSAQARAIGVPVNKAIDAINSGDGIANLAMENGMSPEEAKVTASYKPRPAKERGEAADLVFYKVIKQKYQDYRNRSGKYQDALLVNGVSPALIFDALKGSNSNERVNFLTSYGLAQDQGIKQLGITGMRTGKYSLESVKAAYQHKLQQFPFLTAKEQSQIFHNIEDSLIDASKARSWRASDEGDYHSYMRSLIPDYKVRG